MRATQEAHLRLLRLARVVGTGARRADGVCASAHEGHAGVPHALSDCCRQRPPIAEAHVASPIRHNLRMEASCFLALGLVGNQGKPHSICLSRP